MNQAIFSVASLDFFYNDTQALFKINMEIMPQKVTALIGPSGCGKSTFLRCLNRMNDTIPGTRVSGTILLDGEDINAPDVDLAVLRQRVGMVFQKPNPFPQPIYDNVAFGPRVLGLVDGTGLGNRNGSQARSRASQRAELDEIIERSLRQAALWDEVKDNLHRDALELSLGQQQRLCLARVLAVQPEVILMDEPASALDPIATERLEDLIHELKNEYTIVIVTHNMSQAARVSDSTGFFWLGELVEFSPTSEIFVRPRMELTETYITGRIG